MNTRTGLARVDARGDLLAGWIGRMATGDESALVALYDATASLVFGLVLRIVGDRLVAEEVAGDAYLQVWRQAARFDRARGTPLAWLLTVARSRAIDRVRSTGRRAAAVPEAVEREDAPVDAPDVLLEAHDRRRRVRAALAQLRPEQRQAVELAYFGGLSHGQIAVRLSVPLGTVKTRLRLGMGHLRATLAGGEGSDG